MFFLNAHSYSENVLIRGNTLMKLSLTCNFIRKDQERNDVREKYIMKAFVETNWHLANIFKMAHIFIHIP